MIEAKLFTLSETKESDTHTGKVFTSEYYTLKVIRNKEYEYKRVELSRNGSIFAVPQIFVGDNEDNFKLDIQTASYGSLDESQFTQYIETQQNVLSYVAEIKQIIEAE